MLSNFERLCRSLTGGLGYRSVLAETVPGKEREGGCMLKLDGQRGEVPVYVFLNISIDMLL